MPAAAATAGAEFARAIDLLCRGKDEPNPAPTGAMQDASAGKENRPASPDVAETVCNEELTDAELIPDDAQLATETDSSPHGSRGPVAVPARPRRAADDELAPMSSPAVLALSPVPPAALPAAVNQAFALPEKASTDEQDRAAPAAADDHPDSLSGSPVALRRVWDTLEMPQSTERGAAAAETSSDPGKPVAHADNSGSDLSARPPQAWIAPVPAAKRTDESTGEKPAPPPVPPFEPIEDVRSAGQAEPPAAHKDAGRQEMPPNVRERPQNALSPAVFNLGTGAKTASLAADRSPAPSAHVAASAPLESGPGRPAAGAFTAVSMAPPAPVAPALPPSEAFSPAGERRLIDTSVQGAQSAPARRNNGSGPPEPAMEPASLVAGRNWSPAHSVQLPEQQGGDRLPEAAPPERGAEAFAADRPPSASSGQAAAQSDTGGPSSGVTEPARPVAPLGGTPVAAPLPGSVSGVAPHSHLSQVHALQPPAPHRQLADAIVRTKDGVVEIQLDPVELGRVTVFLGTDHRAGLGIIAERPETLDLIRRHSDQLLQDLKENGMPDARLDFTRQDNSHGNGRGRGQSQQQPDHGQGAPVPSPVPPPPARPAMRAAASANRIDIRL